MTATAKAATFISTSTAISGINRYNLFLLLILFFIFVPHF